MRFFIIVIFILSGFKSPLFAQTQEGLASVRPLAHEGIMTKSGERFYHDSLVASHRHIPFGSLVKITNLKTRKSIEVIINDRGPFINGRIIDLSEAAADSINMRHGDLSQVRLQILKIEKNYKPEISTFETDSNASFTIQVGSYSNQKNAMNYTKKLATDYKISEGIKIKSENVNGKNLYKVYIGKFATRQVAEDFKTQLPKELQNGYVTTIKR